MLRRQRRGVDRRSFAARHGGSHRWGCVHLAAARTDQQSAQAFFIVALGAGVADADGKPIPLLDRVGHRPPGHGQFELALNVVEADAIAGGLAPIDVDFQVALAHSRRCQNVARATDWLERRFDLSTYSDDRIEVWPEHLDASIGPHAGGEHLDAIDDRLRKNVAPGGGTCSTRPISSSNRSPLGPVCRAQRNTPLRKYSSNSGRMARINARLFATFLSPT